MLLRHRPPKLDTKSVNPRKGFEHLDQKWISLLGWLNANRIDYVVVGPAAEAIRARTRASGPTAIVPAPYRRNFERLARALSSAHVRQRVDRMGDDEPESIPVKLTAEKLARGQRWSLRCGAHDLDVEGRPADAPAESQLLPGYQELLYEASRFELAGGLSVEVASPEDIEHYAHVRRTGTAPEIRITRNTKVSQDSR